MLRPHLSIIMPVLNEATEIVASLTALQGLRAQSVEVIVADGGSTDGTPDLAAALADRVLGSRPGRAAQMNAGVRASHGKTLLFLHADTRLPEQALSAVLDAVTDGAVWGRFDVVITGHHRLLKVIAWAMNGRSRLTGIATGDQAIFVRRQVFEALGGFPDQPLMEDIWLSAALKRIAPPHCLHDRVLTSGRRWEKHGVLKTVLLMWRLRAEYALGGDPAKLAERYGYRVAERDERTS